MLNPAFDGLRLTLFLGEGAVFAHLDDGEHLGAVHMDRRTGFAVRLSRSRPYRQRSCSERLKADDESMRVVRPSAAGEGQTG